MRAGGRGRGRAVYREVARVRRSRAAKSPDPVELLAGGGSLPRSRFRERVVGGDADGVATREVLGRALRVDRLWLTGASGLASAGESSVTDRQNRLGTALQRRCFK